MRLADITARLLLLSLCVGSEALAARADTEQKQDGTTDELTLRVSTGLGLIGARASIDLDYWALGGAAFGLSTAYLTGASIGRYTARTLSLGLAFRDRSNREAWFGRGTFGLAWGSAEYQSSDVDAGYDEEESYYGDGSEYSTVVTGSRYHLGLSTGRLRRWGPLLVGPVFDLDIGGFVLAQATVSLAIGLSID